MLVKDVMNSPVLTVEGQVSLEAAYHQMLRHNIRHIPVVEAGRLVGMITDRDIRLATSPFAPEGARPVQTPVREVMSRPVLTADPLDPVEEAARIMRERKIGALPVVEEGRVVGIVTGIDLLDALLRLTGVQKPSGRLEVALDDRPGELARLCTAIAQKNINIHSLLTYPMGKEQVNSVVRVDTPETRRLAQALRQQGFRVHWPPEIPGKP
ncbi:CBS domain-containing protein [Meiothermus sp. QL-1]|uniref:CBS and ACT domain-containing protein n=1 Tax=Meiothermus sp. QL-1 TaxID=2058095 RepID=UPI000E09E6CF|nr:CBS and ACT domain-containing protein [Meiothermus sp. QL-1]RDI95998.1 CBS domain-containing protein [Meiothermus sp. QL-1]